MKEHSCGALFVKIYSITLRLVVMDESVGFVGAVGSGWRGLSGCGRIPYLFTRQDVTMAVFYAFCRSIYEGRKRITIYLRDRNELILTCVLFLELFTGNEANSKCEQFAYSICREACVLSSIYEEGFGGYISAAP